MATPTQEEIEDFIKEETEYQSARRSKNAYVEAVIEGNANDNA